MYRIVIEKVKNGWTVDGGGAVMDAPDRTVFEFLPIEKGHVAVDSPLNEESALLRALANIAERFGHNHVAYLMRHGVSAK